MGAEIVGVSVDSHYCHAAFSARLKLEFPLVSDFNREVIGRYAGFYESYEGMREVSRRAIVVVDPTGAVRWTWSARMPDEVPETEHVREVVQDIFQDGA